MEFAVSLNFFLLCEEKEAHGSKSTKKFLVLLQRAEQTRPGLGLRMEKVLTDTYAVYTIFEHFLTVVGCDSNKSRLG